MKQVKEMKQMCPKCKGTGINKDKVKKDDQGRVVLAPPYQKGEGDRPQYENCRECLGEGMTLQPVPSVVFEDGVKKELSPDEVQQRYAIAT